MDEIIKEHLEAFGAKREKGPYKPGTVKIYVRNITILHKLVNEGKPFDDLDWTRDYDKVSDALGKVPNLQTRKNYLNSMIITQQVLGFGSDIIQQYIALREIYKAEYDKAGPLTTNQKVIMDAVSKDDILSHIGQSVLGLKGVELGGNHKDFQMLCVLDIHTRYPLRNELGEMKAIRRLVFDKLTDDEQNSTNWYILESGWAKCSFLMTKYKTDQVYGRRVISVDRKTARYIQRLYQLRGIKLKEINHKPLLTWENGMALSRNQLSTQLTGYTKKHFGHSISTTLLAKYFGTEIKNAGKPTLLEIKSLQKEAEIRGHSLKTKLGVYSV